MGEDKCFLITNYASWGWDGMLIIVTLIKEETVDLFNFLLDKFVIN